MLKISWSMLFVLLSLIAILAQANIDVREELAQRASDPCKDFCDNDGLCFFNSRDEPSCACLPDFTGPYCDFDLRNDK